MLRVVIAFAFRTGRDVVPNVPDLFGGIGVRCGWGGRGARNSESKPGYYSFVRREEEIRDVGDNVPPVMAVAFYQGKAFNLP